MKPSISRPIFKLCLAIIVVGLSFFLYHSIFLYTSIKPIHSFNEVNFDEINPNTLVIFDVDETLIQPADAYVMNENTPQGGEFKKNLVLANPQVKNWDELATIKLIHARRPLVEPTVMDKIHKLKSRGIQVIALTAMNTGPWAQLPSMEQWRYEQLKSLGFVGSFEDKQFHLKRSAKKPVFYKGILATDTDQKGRVLGEFLDEMRLSPQEIVMFDDTLEFLDQVKEEAKKRHIKFKGFHYLRAITKPWNQKLFEFQANYLIKYHHWLNDDEARELMQQQNENKQMIHG